MARVSLRPPRTLTNRFIAWYSRRKFGAELEPALAAGHNRKVLLATLRLQAASQKWDRAPGELKMLAVMRAAVALECQWCIDFGYWHGVMDGVDRDKIAAVAVWPDSTVFTPLEQQVLEYADAMTATPPQVGDELAERLRDALTEAGLVELTAAISLENLNGRNNSALGLRAQGFKTDCELPSHG